MLDMQPITEDQAAWAFTPSGFEDLETNLGLDINGTTILLSVLPVPKKQPSVADIAEFKREYGAELCRFRAFVEAQLIELAQIQPSLRDTRMRLFADELGARKDEIIRMYEAASWGLPRFATLCTIVAGASSLSATVADGMGVRGVAAAAPPLAAAYAALGDARPRMPDLRDEPLAYAISYRQKMPPSTDSGR